ncbi:MAG TPA: hypothetical protein VJI12_01395 [archaeon]|nr:hypothetical protein [archaeon]
MQNQGVGISDGLRIETSPGYPYQAFPDWMKKFSSPVAVAGLRYATEGERSGKNDSPPIDVSFRDMQVHIAHNGNIPYSSVLRAWLENIGYQHTRTTDTESLGALLLNEISECGNIAEGTQKIVKNLEDAACSVVAVFPKQSTMVAYKDQQGYRPLFMYWDESRGLCMFASEDPAIYNISEEFDESLIREVERGEVIVVNKDGVKSYKTENNRPETLCSFEHVYFARPDTSLQGLNVAFARSRLGEKLWDLHKINDGVIVPDSESGDYGAQGYSKASGRPYFKALPKERYPIIDQNGMNAGQRGFMTATDTERRFVAKKRLKIRDFVEGRHVASVMDSNVRGTTVLGNLKNLAAMGAKSVDVLVTYGPIRSACHWGIDYRGINELSLKGETSGTVEGANEFMKAWVNERAGKLKLNSWTYMTPEGLIEVLGDKTCMKCQGIGFDGTVRLPEFLAKFYRNDHMLMK